MTDSWNGMKFNDNPEMLAVTDEEWEKHCEEMEELMFEGVPEEQLPTIDIREHEALINRKRNLH